MFENIKSFFKKFSKNEKIETKSKDKAKERLHLVLMQDRANVSADFLELMKQEIIEVIKKYIDVDEGAIDVRLTNKENEDGTNGAPALYANIPILNIKNEARKIEKQNKKEENKEKEDNAIEEDKKDNIKSEESNKKENTDNKNKEKNEDNNKNDKKEVKEIAEEKETKEELNQNKESEQ